MWYVFFQKSRRFKINTVDVTCKTGRQAFKIHVHNITTVASLSRPQNTNDASASISCTSNVSILQSSSVISHHANKFHCIIGLP